MLSLPAPAAIYFELAPDAEETDLADAFASDAIVRDEHKEHRGIGAIRDWRVDTMARTPFRARPLSVEQRDGIFVIPAEVTGSFPGSPLILDHFFRIRDGKIATLEIK